MIEAITSDAANAVNNEVKRAVAVDSNADSSPKKAPPPPPPPQQTADTAELSVTARAKLLEQRGLSVGEIADELGLTANVVQSDLGIPITIPQIKVAAQ